MIGRTSATSAGDAAMQTEVTSNLDSDAQTEATVTAALGLNGSTWPVLHWLGLVFLSATAGSLDAVATSFTYSKTFTMLTF